MTRLLIYKKKIYRHDNRFQRNSRGGLRQLLASGEWRKLEHVRICGLMMMASYVDDEQQIRSEFRLAKSLFDEAKAQYFADDAAFCERSWGMSHDYRIAVEEGSTMVRIGTTIFGPRVY